MTKQIADFKLVQKQDFGRSVLLKLRAEQALPEIAPGQFVQVTFVAPFLYTMWISNTMKSLC